MLVLSRKRNESVIIRAGNEVITVMTVDILGDKVRLGFEAGRNITIHREEVDRAIQKGINDGNS